MPTNTSTPNTSAAIDRLALSVDSPRGSEPATTCPPSGCWCSDAEASGGFLLLSCFEAQ